MWCAGYTIRFGFVGIVNAVDVVRCGRTIKRAAVTKLGTFTNVGKSWRASDTRASFSLYRGTSIRQRTPRPQKTKAQTKYKGGHLTFEDGGLENHGTHATRRVRDGLETARSDIR